MVWIPWDRDRYNRGGAIDGGLICPALHSNALLWWRERRPTGCMATMLCMIDWTNLAVIYEMWCCEQVHESMRKLCVVIRFRPGQVAQRWHANWFLTEELDWVACDDGYQGMWVLDGRAQLVKVTLVPRRWFFNLNAFHCSLLLVHLAASFFSSALVQMTRSAVNLAMQFTRSTYLE